MAITYSIYSNGNARAKTISVDFDAQIMASSILGVSSEQRYFFKIVNRNVDTSGNIPRPRTVHGLDQLALGGVRQAAASNSSADYTDIKSMIVDYIYDEINGHAENAKGVVGLREKAPMRFS